MSKVWAVIATILVAILTIVIIGLGIFTAYAPDQVIHFLNGKTDSEYSALNAQFEKGQADLKDAKNKNTALDKQVADLSGKVNSWNKLVCSNYTWKDVKSATYWYDLNMKDSGKIIGTFAIGKNTLFFYTPGGLALDVVNSCLIIR